MLAYVTRRILATIPVMLIVALFVFSLLYLAPGDPAAIIAGHKRITSAYFCVKGSSNATRQKPMADSIQPSVFRYLRADHRKIP